MLERASSVSDEGPVDTIIILLDLQPRLKEDKELPYAEAWNELV